MKKTLIGTHWGVTQFYQLLEEFLFVQKELLKTQQNIDKKLEIVLNDRPKEIEK